MKQQKMMKLLAGILVLSFIIVGFSAPNALAKDKPYKIMAFSFRPSGAVPEAFNAYLKSLEDELNFKSEVRFAGHQGAQLYKNVESAIAEGYKGIIILTDKGNTNELVDLCAQNGVYLGSAWHNQGASLNTSKAGFNFLGNEYYVGTISDGPDDMSASFPIYAGEAAKRFNQLSDAEKKGSIGLATMPIAWQPAQQSAVELAYQTLRGKYNIPESAFATQGTQVSVRKKDMRIGGAMLKAGTIQWPGMDATTRSLPTTYFEENPSLKLLISAVPYNFLEASLQTADLHGKIMVWTSAFDKQDALIKNFGTGGDQTYQGTRTCPIEVIAYPLAQILDKLAGHSYPDKEAFRGQYYGKKIEKNNFKLKGYMILASSDIVLTTDAHMDAFANHYVYGTGNGADNILPASELKKYMKTYNPDATYKALKEKFSVNGDLKIEKLMATVKK